MQRVVARREVAHVCMSRVLIVGVDTLSNPVKLTRLETHFCRLHHSTWSVNLFISRQDSPEVLTHETLV